MDVEQNFEMRSEINDNTNLVRQVNANQLIHKVSDRDKQSVRESTTCNGNGRKNC